MRGPGYAAVAVALLMAVPRNLIVVAGDGCRRHSTSARWNQSDQVWRKSHGPHSYLRLQYTKVIEV